MSKKRNPVSFKEMMKHKKTLLDFGKEEKKDEKNGEDKEKK